MKQKPSTATAVWIALATLHKENPQKEAFQAKEIADKIKELDIQSASDGTVSTHISSHCVANKPAQPDTHRKIIRVRQGWYRLFVKGDYYDDTRKKGQIKPLPEMIPDRFHNLIKWYDEDYVNQKHNKPESEFESPMEIIYSAKKKEDPEFASINTNNTIQIPDKIIKKLNLKSGDHIAFIPFGADDVILKKAKVRLEV